MNEQNKVFKKIKVKRAVPAPVAPQPLSPDLDFEEDDFDTSILNNFDYGESKITTSSDNNKDDDEFERLLNEFISSELETVETEIEEIKSGDKIPSKPKSSNSGEIGGNLNDEEKSLYLAYKNYTNSIELMAKNNGINLPNFKFNANMLYPRYKPAVGRKIAIDTILGWEVILRIHPLNTLNINPNMADEDLLDFAERTTDDTLQLAVISYVEILIEMEGCEISYDERRLKALRKKVEREIYEEHQARINRMQKYVEAIKNKKFPIDADKLIGNYFKTAQKDFEGAYKILTNNPAVFAPIDIKNIKARFFGLIKPTPQDGIRVNRELADFIKKLKI